jgi:hypothetical protein
MKKILIIGLVILGILAVPLFYSTAKGYTQWFWRDPYATVFVDGHQVSGYVHRSGRTAIVTRRDSAQPLSYWIDTTPKSTARLVYCGAWSAPDFFVFAVGDLNMPCMGGSDSETPEAPDFSAPYTSNGTQIEFRTTDFKTIKVVF